MRIWKIETNLLEIETRFPEFVYRNPGWIWRLKDQDGRPFFEGNAPEDIRIGVEFDYRTCPYPGTRHGKLMNVSALRQITAKWDEILGYTAVLRDEYLLTIRSPLTNWHLWLLSISLAAIPALAIRRGKKPEGIGGDIAGLFKVAQGLFMTAGTALASFLIKREELCTPAEFIEYTERLNLFLTGDKYACAGPPHMVLSIVTLVINGGSEPAPQYRTKLKEIVCDYNQLFRYAEIMAFQMILGRFYENRNQLLFEDLISSLLSINSSYANSQSQNLSNQLSKISTAKYAPFEKSCADLKFVLSEKAKIDFDEPTVEADMIASVMAISNQTSNIQSAKDSSAVQILVRELIKSSRFERSILAAFNGLERDLEYTLNIPNRGQLGREDFAEVFPVSASKAIAELLGLRIEDLCDQLVFRNSSNADLNVTVQR